MHDKSGDSGRLGDSWWASLVARVLHPVQVQIIEALRWIDQSLSPADLARIFDEKPEWQVLVHQLRGLTRLGAIVLAETPTQRDAMDIAYRLVVERQSDES